MASYQTNRPMEKAIPVVSQQQLRSAILGVRKAGKDLNVALPQLGAQSESYINGQYGKPEARSR